MSDLLRKYKSLYSSTANSFSTGTSETITPASVTGLPTTTEIILTFDRVDSSGTETPSDMERIIGTISGGNLVVRTSPATGRGADNTTDVAHTTPVVEMIWNAKDWNDLIDAFLVEHGQDGTHGDITAGDLSACDITASTVSASAITASEIVADKISERTSASGVIIDSVRMKDGHVQLKTDGNIKELTATPWKTIDFPAGALSPTTTCPCADIATLEASTNDIDHKVLAFDKDADEKAFVNFTMPGNWDAGVIQFRYIWTTAGGSDASETVVMELAGRAYGDDEAIEQAKGTAVEKSDAWLAVGDLHVSGWSGDVTLPGATAGDWVHLEIARDVSEDILPADAQLIGIQIRYKELFYNHW